MDIVQELIYIYIHDISKDQKTSIKNKKSRNKYKNKNQKVNQYIYIYTIIKIIQR